MDFSTVGPAVKPLLYGFAFVFALAIARIIYENFKK